ncbi:hypothetical protein [Amycolatopsis sp. H20-H5]|uniref:hypothetical protein n=1 Tax=Amycolatopsis sp. H20-H5 TaxID=3046309 RepID=UPI002DB806DC|nr:hypothetical protein [Amycolatopsis sp. H20-H5]MEC3975950.1 hypothetical protein [Amycolatopsis sp. H20-H5]
MHTDMFGIVTGLEAARRYGLTVEPPDTLVHMLVPDSHKFSSAKFTVVERTKYFPEPNVVDGVPLAPPARAVLDGVRRIREYVPVSALLLEALESGLCSPNELSAELEAGSQRGTALPRAVLRQLSEDIRSVPELEAISMWKRAGLPKPLHNAKIFTAQHQFIAMPDYWCDEVALAWEIDSWSFHEKRRHYAKTLARNSRYAGQGISVVQTLPSRLRREPNAVIAELRAAYAAARARPRPNVAAVPSRRSAA